MRSSFAIAAVAALVSLATTARAQDRAPAAARPAQRFEIVQITGDLYRAGRGNWYTVFLVTPAGIILGDPIDTGFATWLKPELDARFKQPVRYVVYSHSHFDHAAGGRVFADTAQFVGHENMARNMDGRYPQMPGDMVDRNNNGRFDYEDIDIPTNARPGVCGFSRGFFTLFDKNSDKQVTPQELQADIVPPTILYSERMTLKLGGKTVELSHPGLNHSDDATVMLFPAERVAFATEFLADALVTDNIMSLPSACGPFDGSPLAEWIKSYRSVEALDFDVLATGHGSRLFAKSDVAPTREFFEDLTSQVSAGMAAGKTLDELKQTITLDKYKSWANYERLRTWNVEAAYLNLKLYR